MNSQKGTTAAPVWMIQTSGTTASLRGIHSLAGGVAWASGTDGTVLRTEDGGYIWQKCVVPKGAEKLDFRGVWGWDAQTAVVMSSGPGDASRIYKTKDGCQSWKLMATNKFKDGFWDGIWFFDKTEGWLLGDPVDGKFQVFRILFRFNHAELTQDQSPGLKADKNTEGAFAASNSSLTDGATMFGTGGKAGASVYLVSSSSVCVDCEAEQYEKNEMHRTWKKVSVPLAAGKDSEGVFSVENARRINDMRAVVAVGGNYEEPAEPSGTAAYSLDDGETWMAAAVPPHGYRSAVAWDQKNKVWIAAGTNGSDYSRDNGKTWVPLDDGAWNALSLPYVVGPKGRIAKLADGALAAR